MDNSGVMTTMTMLTMMNCDDDGGDDDDNHCDGVYGLPIIHIVCYVLGLELEFTL